MHASVDVGSRRRILEAAADLVSASPGRDVPLREICDRAGVQLPTLYHYFGSKDGLIGAVVDHGFDMYVGEKTDHESSGDPIQDIREGWDLHVAFGLSHPGFYVLMYGQSVPGSTPAGQERATSILRGLTSVAEEQGRLIVASDLAATLVLTANVGVTLHQIVVGRPSAELSIRMRESVIDGITGRRRVREDDREQSVSAAAGDLLTRLENGSPALAAPETVLLKKWLAELTQS